MDEHERQKMLQLLVDGNLQIQTSTAGIDEADAARLPESGGWSIVGCLEHVAVTELALFAGLRGATKAPAPLPNPEREAKIWNRALDRGRSIPAPEIVLPQGHCATLSQALLTFATARAETIRWVETFPDDPRSWLTTHPLVRSPVNCWEMLLMIALHSKRHAEQIAHIRAALSPH